MNNKIYDGLESEEDVKELNLYVDIMCDEHGDGMVGLSEIVSVICGEDYYNDYDDEDLDYVREVVSEYCGVNVGFDLENECVYVESRVDE